MPTVTRADPRAVQLGKDVDSMVKRKFGGDYEKAFKAYSKGGKEVSAGQVGKLLEDANVGNFLTRGAYTSAVMDKFDTNRSGGISWNEFSKGMDSLR